jgi:hypothetical protein
VLLLTSSFLFNFAGVSLSTDETQVAVLMCIVNLGCLAVVIALFSHNWARLGGALNGSLLGLLVLPLMAFFLLHQIATGLVQLVWNGFSAVLRFVRGN